MYMDKDISKIIFKISSFRIGRDYHVTSSHVSMHLIFFLILYTTTTTNATTSTYDTFYDFSYYTPKVTLFYHAQNLTLPSCKFSPFFISSMTFTKNRYKLPFKFKDSLNVTTKRSSLQPPSSSSFFPTLTLINKLPPYHQSHEINKLTLLC